MLVGLGVVGDQADAQILVGSDQGLHLHRPAMQIVNGIAVDQVHPAIAIGVARGQAQCHRVIDGQVDHALQPQPVVLLVSRLRETADAIEIRRTGNQVYQAGGGVLAKQRALRTFKNLDAFEVEKIGRGQQARATAVDAIHERGQGGIEPHVENRTAQTPDGERRARSRLLDRLHLQGGDHRLQGIDVVDLVLLEHRGVYRRDGDRDLLERLLALLGGDDDFLDLGGRGRR